MPSSSAFVFQCLMREIKGKELEKCWKGVCKDIYRTCKGFVDGYVSDWMRNVCVPRQDARFHLPVINSSIWVDRSRACDENALQLPRCMHYL